MTRRFGIELEHINSRSHGLIVVGLRDAGVTVDDSATGMYRSRGWNGWQVKHDCSIVQTRTHPHQIELVSPPLPFNDAGKESVQKAVSVVASTGKVNRSCGFHVHVEARDLNNEQIERLSRSFKTWRKVLMSYVSISRRNNRFCKPTTSRNDRYVALNMVPLTTHGTVEFRLHQGTLNADKILAFVALCVNLVESAKSNRQIDNVEKNPASCGTDRLIKHFDGIDYVVERHGNGWKFNDIIYDSLTVVANVIRNKRSNGPRFFGYPMTGNAMDQLCRDIGLAEDYREFLARTYDRAVTQWGYFND